LNQIADTAATAQEDHANELRQFLDCVKESSVTDLAQEQDRIKRALPIVIAKNQHWRRTEDWIAEQADAHPKIAVNLYDVMVQAAADDTWSSTARTSRESNREQIYENAAAADGQALQTALEIANKFASKRYELDREFLETHL